MKKQNHNNKPARLTDAQFEDAIRGILKIWSLMLGNFCPNPAEPERKLAIAGFLLKENHPIAEKVKHFFADVKSEQNQEAARRDALAVKQALLGLLRAFLRNHVRFFDNELAAAFAGVNNFLEKEYASGSDKLFDLIKVTKWDPALAKRIEKRRAELQEGTTKLQDFTDAEEFLTFIALQNQTLTFIRSVCNEMKQIAGKKAGKLISEKAAQNRMNPATVGKEPAKKVAPAPKAPAFNPALAELLSSVV